MLKCRTEINEEALKVLRRISLYRGRNVKIAVAAVTGFMALDFHTIAWQMHSVKVMVLAVLCAVVCLVTVMSLSGLIVAMRTRMADRSLTSGWRVYHIDGSSDTSRRLAWDMTAGMRTGSGVSAGTTSG